MRIVVVGGVAAGMSAASQARRRDPTCEVIVLQREPDISYSACGMPYNIGDPMRVLDDLVILDAAAARAERGIDVFATALHARMTLAQVEALDLTYAPPFAPVCDPVLVAATVGLKVLAKAR